MAGVAGQAAVIEVEGLCVELSIGGKPVRALNNISLTVRAGETLAERLRKDIHELIIAPRREHSRKPVEVRARIERYSEGPYLEMFAREPAAGWTAWGNDTDKFARSACWAGDSKSTVAMS
jgi:N6-adenosine-specific RNA methylase IME4